MTPSYIAPLLPLAGSHVRFTKLVEKTPGVVEVGHVIEGVLIRDVREGECAFAVHDLRTPDDDPEYRVRRFNTSTIMNAAWTGDRWHLLTRNSTWELALLDTPAPADLVLALP